jgi:hypothetical protein
MRQKDNYNDNITKSNNTIKTTWNIIGAESGKQQMNAKNFKTGKINPNAFNNYFLTISENITHNISTQITSDTDNNRNYKYYLNLTAKSPFPKLIFNNVTTQEIESYFFFTFRKFLWL